MAEIGKHAPNLQGFPTPNTAADISSYLLLYFPDKEWAQYALGALKVLQFGYNWYKSGDLDPEEAADFFKEILNEAPYNLKTCANPDGGKIIRVAPNGRVQQLSDANEWEDPTGDYEIPPVPDREESDPVCLAAMNCANVLQLLYENVTDSFNNDLDEAEAATALTLTLVSLIGAEFAPITFALVTFFGIVFSVLYGLLEFIGADLWDEDFTKSLVCILQGCATNTDGVITFQWECFNDALAAQVTIVDLTVEQLRLFGQLQYLLLVIGGVDALNQAGATTAITVADCDYCGGWCRRYNGDVGWGAWYSAGGYAALVDGVWKSGSAGGDARVCAVAYDFAAIELTEITMYAYSNNPANTGGRGFYRIDGSVTQFAFGTALAGAQGLDWSGDQSGAFTLQCNWDTVSSDGMTEIREILLYGTGTPPPDGEPC